MAYALTLMLAFAWAPRVAFGSELVLSTDPALVCPSADEVRTALRRQLVGIRVEDRAPGEGGARTASLQLQALGPDSFEVVFRLDGTTLRRVLPAQRASCATSATTIALLTDAWMHESIEPDPEPPSEPTPSRPREPGPTLARARDGRDLRTVVLRMGLAGGAALGFGAEPVARMGTLTAELETSTRWGAGARAVVAEFSSGFRPITAFGSVRLFARGATRLAALAGVSLDLDTRGSTSHVLFGDALWVAARWDWQAWSRYSVFAELGGSSIFSRYGDLPRAWEELSIGVACRL